jgi:innexin
MFLMDRFFDGAFLTFGLEVIAFAEQDQEDRLDPLIYVFPRMTKVKFTQATARIYKAKLQVPART